MTHIKKAAVTKLAAFYASAKKAKPITVEARSFYSLTYRYSGKISVKTDEVEFISPENSITFVPKGVSYTNEIIEDMEMAVLHFELDGDIDFRTPAVFNIKDNSIRPMFEKLVRSYREDDPCDFSVMSLLYEIFAKLAAEAPAEASSGVPKKIRLAREYISAHCQSSRLSIASVAERLGISSSYLRREFSAAYGESPVSFLQSTRISRAKNMLESEYPTVAEVAEQCGFESVSYFIQAFRKAVGMTPSAWRKR